MDLHNHVFAELERLDDEHLKGDDLTAAIGRVEALQELISKATPKKPKNWKAERRVNGKVEFNCPVCNRLYTDRINYCSSCGQALDWSEEDDSEI